MRDWEKRIIEANKRLEKGKGLRHNPGRVRTTKELIEENERLAKTGHKLAAKEVEKLKKLEKKQKEELIVDVWAVAMLFIIVPLLCLVIGYLFLR